MYTKADVRRGKPIASVSSRMCAYDEIYITRLCKHKPSLLTISFELQLAWSWLDGLSVFPADKTVFEHMENFAM